MRNPGAFIFLLATIVPAATGGNLETIQIRINQANYQVEIASLPAARQKGLMFRKELADNRGMLLEYPDSGDHRVWMKNTLIPLRVYWIDETFRVVIMRRLEPCTASPCPVYAAPEPTRYILELSDHEHTIRPGDLVEGIGP